MRTWWLVIVLGLSACAQWSRKDSALEASFIAVTTIDWGQTDSIVARCGETNPIMGWCGQRVPVGVYFPVSLMAHAAIAALLPPSWRTIFQSATLGMETTTAYWNTRTR